jgi:predicted tellurium resistance membrane protein TerC
MIELLRSPSGNCIQASALVILNLIVIERLLSAGNAVLATMVMHLPAHRLMDLAFSIDNVLAAIAFKAGLSGTPLDASYEPITLLS